MIREFFGKMEKQPGTLEKHGKIRGKKVIFLFLLERIDLSLARATVKEASCRIRTRDCEIELTASTPRLLREMCWILSRLAAKRV